MRAVCAIILCSMRELVRKKDFYILFVLMLVLLGILSSQNFFQIEGVTRYLRDIGYFLVMFFSFIISVTFTAKQIPAEIESKTIYPLLAKPVGRSTIVLGKFCGGVVVSVIAFMVFYSVYCGFYILAGTTDLLLLAQGMIFGISFLCLSSAMAMFLSNFMTVSANLTVLFLLYFIIGGFSETIRNTALLGKSVFSFVVGTVYYIIPHFDFFDLRVRLAHSWDPLPAWAVISVVAYAVAYCALLLMLSSLIFGRKRL